MPVTARLLTSLPPEPPLASNENKDPGASPLSSPKKYRSPSTPKSTPLHRRFLQEVTMSPATSPRTPNHNECENPTKGRDSAAKGRESPSKQKLEIGQNGFYFSCELPMSKVTPKKGGTPKKTGSPDDKDGTTGIQSKRPPSPLKNSSRPAMKSPTRAHIGTPTRRAGTPTQSRAATPVKRTAQSNESPTKSIRSVSKYARGLSSAPIPTMRIPPECLKDVTEEEVASAILKVPAVLISTGRVPPIEKARTSMTSQSLDIGQLMAGLKASAQKTGHPVEDEYSNDRHRPQKSEPPTPLRRAAERLPSTEFSMMPKTDQNNNLNVSVGTQTVRSPPEAIAEPLFALDMMRQEQALQYLPPLFPKSGLDIGEGAMTKEKALLSTKHVKWQDPHSSSSKAKRMGTPTIEPRIGTDPAVLVAMRSEMVKAEASMRRSIGHEYLFRGPINNNELPMMPNSLIQKDQEAKVLDPVSTQSTSKALCRTNSDTSSIGTVRASMVMSAQKRTDTLNAQSTSQPLSYITTPVSARRGKIATTKQADQLRSKVSSAPKTSHTSPRRLATIKPTITPRSVLMTPRRRSAIPCSVDTPSRLRVRDTTLRATPVVTPARSKIGGTSTPRGGRKSIFNTPSSIQVIPAAKTPDIARKPFPRTPLRATTRKTAHPVAPEPYKPATDPRPYEKKFASAVDIADRVAQWNSEDRKKAAPSVLPTTPHALKSPIKSSIQPAKQTMNKKSYTPQGSPTKLSSPIKHPHLQPTSGRPSPSPKPPRTPAPRAKTAVNRLRDMHTLKAPASRRISVLDRNAARTPSKAIESSLDRAIDAKIAEDAASGKEFTPSGNRIRDLLDARGRK
ncbi:Nn.00g014700.m01.CDS01 [Neocucurbitaria sp. VM-36]